MGESTIFVFSTDCYFDKKTNVIVDHQNGQIINNTHITGKPLKILLKLLEDPGKQVSTEDLFKILELTPWQGREVVADEVYKLKKKHVQLKNWIPNSVDGSYQLLKPGNLNKKAAEKKQSREKKTCTLQDTNILMRSNFVAEARTEIFYELDDAFQKSNVAFLWGIGGIGKSEVAKHWANQKKREKEYTTVVFGQLDAPKGKDIQTLISDDLVFVLTEGFSSQYEKESKSAYFTRKLKTIRQVTNGKTLLIIDNYDEDDPFMEELLKGPYQLLVTTRNEPQKYNFPTIRVKEIQNIEHLKKIFFGYLDGERDDICKDDPSIKELFELVSNHTLAIEIMAKYLKYSLETPASLAQKMREAKGYSLIGNMKDAVEEDPFETIKALFNISQLKNRLDFRYTSQVLSFMTAMPTKGISLKLLQSWSNNQLKKARGDLVKRSWLQQDVSDGEKYISMHPLIREVVWHNLMPSLDQFSTIVEDFTHDDDMYVDCLYHKPKDIKDQYEQVALSLLAAFPLRNLDQFEFYNKILRILRLCANAGAALSLANGLKTCLEAANQENSWRYGLVNHQLGTIHASLLRQRKDGNDYYDKALKLMEKHSKSDEEKMWLAFLYREVASVDCQDKHLYATRDPEYVKTIQEYLDKGEALVDELLARDRSVSNLKIFHGTLCVWRSKLAIWYGNLEEASQLLVDAEEEFKKYQYANAVDKSAIADVRALICAQKGDYAGEIDALMDASTVFWGGFREHHYAFVERLLKLAKAYINNAYKNCAHDKKTFKMNLQNAQNVLLRCQEILRDMKQSENDRVNLKFAEETIELQKKIGNSLQTELM